MSISKLGTKQVFRNLNRIGGGAFTQVIGNDEKVQGIRK
jgi:hypothetical protein